MTKRRLRGRHRPNKKTPRQKDKDKSPRESPHPIYSIVNRGQLHLGVAPAQDLRRDVVQAAYVLVKLLVFLGKLDAEPEINQLSCWARKKERGKENSHIKATTQLARRGSLSQVWNGEGEPVCMHMSTTVVPLETAFSTYVELIGLTTRTNRRKKLGK